jgi:ubiquinone/menaquinone biosynthesis C-methylase UbiE
MEFTNRFQGTSRHIKSHWPTYLFGYCGGIVLSVFIVGLSAIQGWYSFIILGLTAFLLLAFFLSISLWAANRIYDGHKISDALIHLSNAKPVDTINHVGLGRKTVAVELSSHFTTGKIIVVDIYNPQIMPSRELARARHQAIRPNSDPRLSWRDGSINLLPLPDSSVSAVTMSETLGEIWQQGDQRQLLEEIFRVLKPGGSVLFAERLRTPTNLIVLGPSAFRFHSVNDWARILADSGLDMGDQKSIGDLICCFQAQKPIISIQLSLWDSI